MKNLSYLFMFFGLAAMLFLASCKDDDEGPLPAAPSVTKAADAAVQVGKSIDLTFSIQAAGGFKSATVTPASATIKTSPAAGALTGDVVVTFTAGTSEGTETVTVTTTDNNDLTGAASTTITVTASAVPTIADIPATANVEAGATLGPVTATLEAEDGLKSFSITKNGETFGDTQNFSGETSTTVDFEYVPSVTEAGTDVVFEFTVEDNDGQTSSFTHTLTVDFTVITDADLIASTTYNWVKEKAYLLDGLVYLEEGGVLNIEAGTIIKFVKTPTSGSDNTSALFVTKGAKIMAEGTATDPIIFTAQLDDLTGATLLPTDNEQWGGLVVLGKAPAEKKGATADIQIEGIDSGEPRGAYGGATADDNSGVLKYVSIRYTGVGFEPGSELQGLTLGGVGSGTVIDYIDIFSSADDGIEIFGGTVNIKHVSVAFSTDDDFDFDLGWRGNGQFLFSLMLPGSTSDAYDHSGEWDGASPDDATLFSAPNISNWTAIGPGQNIPDGGRDRALLLRENFSGKVMNSIFEDFPGVGITVEDLKSESTPGSGTFDMDNTNDAYANVTTAKDGFQIEISNNTWANFAGYIAAEGVSSMVKAHSEKDDDGNTLYTGETADVVAELTDNNNKIETSAVLTGISRADDGGLDPRPTAADSDVAAVPAGMDAVTYRGAFDPAESNTWLSGWSTLAKLGYLAN